MKNYIKKFSIMFVMLLAVVGVGVFQDGIEANAATIGQQLTQPEDGWKRFEDDNANFSYVNGGRLNNTTSIFSGGSSMQFDSTYGGTVKFNFTGTKLRLIFRAYNYGSNPKISIDGGTPEDIPCNKYDNFIILVYDNNSLTNSEHYVTITSPVHHVFDAVDIDKNGVLKPYAENILSISLDKTSMDLIKGDSKQLTATTPVGAEAVWTSSDESIATVDSTGKVTGVKEGTCIVTVTLANGTKATCIVTVTPPTTSGGTSDPTDPGTTTGGTGDTGTTTTGDANLFIELVDGNIKQYNVSSGEIDNFIQWFKDRDNDDSQSPYYKFTKGSYKDYVVHDKIDWFEIR